MFSRSLARVIVSGPWTQLSTIARCRLALPLRTDVTWLPDLVERMFVHFGDRTIAPPQIAIEQFLQGDDELKDALSLVETVPPVNTTSLARPEMIPALAAFDEWNLPSLTTVQQTAEWFHVAQETLVRLADPLGFETRREVEAARHYHYRYFAKPGGRVRLIESPKSRLKTLQRRLLSGLLDRVPPHPAAHAFRRGRSVKTCLLPHVGRKVVLHYDLREFFPSIRASRVFGLFRTLGYPEPVARILTGLCTNRTPRDVRATALNLVSQSQASSTDIHYRSAHLPQGAPTSPAIANLISYRLDCRLHGLATTMGAQYTRYADDLIFSGDTGLNRSIRRFGTFVLAVLLDEGFSIHHRKTRILSHGNRQQVAGVVVNHRLNTPRHDYDTLRAILFNCIQHGPMSQNRNGHKEFRSHLLGRIQWVAMLNPTRGTKLRTLYQQIEW